MYCTHVVIVIWRQTFLPSEDGYMHLRLCPNKKGESNVHGPMGTSFFGEVYRLKPDEVMERKEDGLVWEDISASMPTSFVRICQIFSGKTATSLRSSAIVTYSVHMVFMNFSEG